MRLPYIPVDIQDAGFSWNYKRFRHRLNLSIDIHISKMFISSEQPVNKIKASIPNTYFIYKYQQVIKT